MDALFSLLIIYMAVTLISVSSRLKQKETFDPRCDEMNYLWQNENYLDIYDPAARKKEAIEEVISLLPLIKGHQPVLELQESSMLALP